MATTKNKVIVIDTNLWISFLLTKNFSKFERIIADPNCTIIVSEELLDELQEVAQRPKFKKYFSLSDLDDLLTAIRNTTMVVAVSSNLQICRDPKDDFLLSLAKDGAATHLLTGDKDLLTLQQSGKTTILSVTDYLSEIRY